MARQRRRWLWIASTPLLALFACVGPRSIQGPVSGQVALADGVPRDDVVARLRCTQAGIHGGIGAGREARVFDSEARFRFWLAWRGWFPMSCAVEVLHPLYQMAYTPLGRRFRVDVGTLALPSWDALLASPPDGLSEADLHRHLFYLRHYYLPVFDESERAALAGYVPALHALLERGLRTLPPMDRDRFGSTKDSLSQLRTIESLVGYERPPEQRALFAAAGAGDVDGVRRALAAGADPDAWDADHAAAIHRAAAGKRIEVVRTLLDAGADVDRQEEGLGLTALLRALLAHDEATARLLVERGADVTLAGGGRVPLVEAAGRSSRELVELLIARGAVARTRDPMHPARALHGAARGGRSDVVATLLEAGVPVDAGLPGFTAFMQAAWKGKLETARLLLDAGADPNAVSITGMTALAYARSENRAAVVAWLEGLGATE